jgi:hypothetical protein
MARQVLRRSAHKFSPRRYTQPQLFACLALKAFFKTDYRGAQALLQDHSDLRAALGLRTVPHFTTLQKASKRLLRLRRARRLFAAAVRRFLGLKQAKAPGPQGPASRGPRVRSIPAPLV